MQNPSLGIGRFDDFSKTLCFFKHTFSENASKTLYRWSVFDAETITKHVIFRHMQFLRGNSDDFQVEKDHFQKSDIFAMSKSEVHREIT